MKALLINLLGLIGSWHLIDLSADSALRSGFAPILFTLFLISSLLWLIVTFGQAPGSRGGSYFGGDSGGLVGGAGAGANGGGGGDCGGADRGC